MSEAICAGKLGVLVRLLAALMATPEFPLLELFTEAPRRMTVEGKRPEKLAERPLQPFRARTHRGSTGRPEPRPSPASAPGTVLAAVPL